MEESPRPSGTPSCLRPESWSKAGRMKWAFRKTTPAEVNCQKITIKSPLPCPAYKLKVAVQRTATFLSKLFSEVRSARPVNSLGSAAPYRGRRGPPRATLPWSRRPEHREGGYLAQRASTRKGRNVAQALVQRQES